MIKERYCSFEVAKLLKEKGFDEPCVWAYDPNSVSFAKSYYEPKNSELNEYEYSKPTHQMALDYLREEHNILIWFSPVIPTPIPKDKTVFYWEWEAKKKLHSHPHVQSHIKHETFEEAVEASLKYCLTELIK